MRQSPWETLLPVLFVLGFVLGLVGWFLLWWDLSGSLIWGVLAFGATVLLIVKFGMEGLVIGGIVGVMFLLLLALY